MQQMRALKPEWPRGSTDINLCSTVMDMTGPWHSLMLTLTHEMTKGFDENMHQVDGAAALLRALIIKGSLRA